MTRLFLLILLTLINTSSSAGTKPNQSGHAVWEYHGAHGPANWSQLKSDFAGCRIKHHQSPIDINSAQTTGKKAALSFHYQPVPLKIIDTGHTLRMNFTKNKPSEYLVYENKRYHLLNMHLHHPSENTINDQHFPLEVHMVHQNDEGEFLVLGILIREGQDNTLLKAEFAHLPKKKYIEEVHPTDSINPAELIPKDTKLFAYSGSFTTPPCTEGVTWLIFTKPMEASLAQIQTYQDKVIHDNFRPVQPLNGRTVYLITPN